MKTETIEQRLQDTRGRTSGFDYLRIGLSVAVIVFHSAMTSYGPAINSQFQNGLTRPFIVIIVSAFFALSGFLVMRSLARSKTIFEFLTLRAVRLVPALFVEVVISAIILGPLLTTLTLRQYFSSPVFYSYWLNIVGEINYFLPGVFLSNPDPDIVNRQLWTIPVELKCYAVLSFLYLIRVTSNKWSLLAAFVACLILLPFYDMLRGLDVEAINNVPLKVLIESFLAGAVIFSFGNYITLDRNVFILCCLLTFILLLGRHSAYLASLPIAYVTIYLGLNNTRPTIISRMGEYSYGLYIYGYVVQQSYAALFPDYRIWWLNILFSLPVALSLSIISWVFVERRALANRHVAVAAVEWMVEQIAARSRSAPKAANPPPS